MIDTRNSKARVTIINYIVIEPDSEPEMEDYKESEEDIYEYGYRSDEDYQEYRYTGQEEEFQEEYPVWNNERRQDYDDEGRSRWIEVEKEFGIGQWGEERGREMIEILREGYAECGIDKEPTGNPVYEELARKQIEELYERIRQLQEIN